MVLQHDVAVVVDSSSCLPPDLLQEWNITVVPHQLTVGQQTYRDGVDILPDRFYRLLADRRQTRLTSAAPSPRHFLEAFLSAGQRTPNVLCLTLSTRFSSAYSSALSALELANGKSSTLRVEVIDSQAAAGASGLIALAAARWARLDGSLDQVTAKVNRLIPKVNLLAFLDTLHYLRRSGRVRKLEAWAGWLLSIKPITELRLGEARMLEKPRSRARATERLVEIMHQRVGAKPVRINLMEAAAAEDAQALYQRIRSEFNCREIFISQFTPVMGLHTGPGLLGVAFYVDDPDDERAWES